MEREIEKGAAVSEGRGLQCKHRLTSHSLRDYKG